MTKIGTVCTAALLMALCSTTSYAAIIEFEFTDSYLADNWKPTEELPGEIFGIVLSLPENYIFTTKELSTTAPGWLTFQADNSPAGTSLYFGYLGTEGNLFEPGNSISLTDPNEYQFSFNLNLEPISTLILPGEAIEFSVDLYFDEDSIFCTEGTMSLVGIPEPATIILLGLGSFVILRSKSGRR